MTRKFIHLQGLEGTRGLRRAGWFQTAAEIESVLKKFSAATTSGDNGAINVWRVCRRRPAIKVAGKVITPGRMVRYYYCARYRYQATHARAVFMEERLGQKTSAVIRWLRLELPKIQ